MGETIGTVILWGAAIWLAREVVLWLQMGWRWVRAKHLARDEVARLGSVR